MPVTRRVSGHGMLRGQCLGWAAPLESVEVLDHEAIGAGSTGYPKLGYFQKSPIGQAARPSLERHAALSDRVI